MCHSISRGSAVSSLQGRREGQVREIRGRPGAIARQARGRNGQARVDTEVRDGTAKVRGDVSPRAASGGPIRSRLTPGNSAVPALRMPRSDASGFGRPGP